MKVVKWSLVILTTFAVAWILIFTFTQEPFKAAAPVKIFWHTTPGEFPMYLYAAATFGVGLLIGFFVAAYYYIAGRAGIHNKKKEIKRLEGIVQEVTLELERQRVMAAKTQEKITKSMKAVGEKDLMS